MKRSTRIPLFVLCSLLVGAPLASQGWIPSGYGLRVGVGADFPQEVAQFYCEGTRAWAGGASAQWTVASGTSVELGFTQFARRGEEHSCLFFDPLPCGGSFSPCTHTVQIGSDMRTLTLALGHEFELTPGIRPTVRLGFGRLLSESTGVLEWKTGLRIGPRTGPSLSLGFTQLRFTATEEVLETVTQALVEERRTGVAMGRFEVGLEYRR